MVAFLLFTKIRGTCFGRSGFPTKDKLCKLIRDKFAKNVKQNIIK